MFGTARAVSAMVKIALYAMADSPYQISIIIVCSEANFTQRIPINIEALPTHTKLRMCKTHNRAVKALTYVVSVPAAFLLLAGMELLLWLELFYLAAQALGAYVKRKFNCHLSS